MHSSLAQQHFTWVEVWILFWPFQTFDSSVFQLLWCRFAGVLWIIVLLRLCLTRGTDGLTFASRILWCSKEVYGWLNDCKMLRSCGGKASLVKPQYNLYFSVLDRRGFHLATISNKLFVQCRLNKYLTILVLIVVSFSGLNPHIRGHWHVVWGTICTYNIWLYSLLISFFHHCNRVYTTLIPKKSWDAV